MQKSVKIHKNCTISYELLTKFDDLRVKIATNYQIKNLNFSKFVSYLLEKEFKKEQYLSVRPEKQAARDLANLENQADKKRQEVQAILKAKESKGCLFTGGNK